MSLVNWSIAFLPDLWKWEKEDRRLAGKFLEAGNHSAAIRFLGLAEKKEEAIQAKLAEYWPTLRGVGLAYGIPDAERMYPDTSNARHGFEVCPAHGVIEPCPTCEGSEHLRRHPEMVEDLRDAWHVVGNPRVLPSKEYEDLLALGEP